MRRWLSFLPALFVIVSFAMGVQNNEPKRKFKIRTRRQDDTVQVRHGNEKTVFIVKSPFGISDATIERRDDAWPKTVALKLHLKG